MSASGWVVADPKPGAPTPAQAREQALAAIQQAEDCVVAARANPKYDSIRMHMADAQTGRYSFTQMADESVPTAEEAALMANYEDTAEPCRAALVAKITALDATAGAKVRAQFSSSDSLVLSLIARKVSWGEYAKKMQALSDSTAAGNRT